MSSGHGFSRRHFIAGLSVVMAPAIIVCRQQRTRLRIAAVGAGGKGETDIRCSSSEDIVAICDVDENIGRRRAKGSAKIAEVLTRISKQAAD